MPPTDEVERRQQARRAGIAAVLFGAAAAVFVVGVMIGDGGPVRWVMAIALGAVAAGNAVQWRRLRRDDVTPA